VKKDLRPERKTNGLMGRVWTCPVKQEFFSDSKKKTGCKRVYGLYMEAIAPGPDGWARDRK